MAHTAQHDAQTAQDDAQTALAIESRVHTVRGIYHGSTLLALGHALHEARVEAAKPDAEKETEFRARNVPFLLKRLVKRLVDMHPPHEAALLRRAARTARALPLGLLADGIAALEAAAASLETDAAWRPPAAQMSAAELEAALRGEAAPPEEDVSVATAAFLYPGDGLPHCMLMASLIAC